jgi:metal-sulfur cluster biosynthetic enzyme
VNVAEVAEVLSGVFDPELGVDIVSLGLIYAIDVEAQSVHVAMALTSPDCPMADAIASSAAARIARLGGAREVSFEVVDQPEWSIAMADESALRKLGIMR